MTLGNWYYGHAAEVEPFYELPMTGLEKANEEERRNYQQTRVEREVRMAVNEAVGVHPNDAERLADCLRDTVLKCERLMKENDEFRKLLFELQQAKAALSPKVIA